jgi:hypothetical protein
VNEKAFPSRITQHTKILPSSSPRLSVFWVSVSLDCRLTTCRLVKNIICIHPVIFYISYLSYPFTPRYTYFRTNTSPHLNSQHLHQNTFRNFPSWSLNQVSVSTWTTIASIYAAKACLARQQQPAFPQPPQHMTHLLLAPGGQHHTS